MLYKVKYVDNSEELVDAETIAEARKEARCLFDCPIRNIVVQESADGDEDDVDDEDDDGDDEAESAEDDDGNEDEDEDDDEDDDEEDA